MHEPDFDDAPTDVFSPGPKRTEELAVPPSPDGRLSLWGPKDVAAFLNVSRSWVYQKSEEGRLPVIRMPGSSLLRFDPDDVRAYARGAWSPKTPRTVSPAKPRA